MVFIYRWLSKYLCVLSFPTNTVSINIKCTQLVKQYTTHFIDPIYSQQNLHDLYNTYVIGQAVYMALLKIPWQPYNLIIPDVNRIIKQCLHFRPKNESMVPDEFAVAYVINMFKLCLSSQGMYLHNVWRNSLIYIYT